MPKSSKKSKTPEATDGSPGEDEVRLEDLEVSEEEADRLHGGATAQAADDPKVARGLV